MKITVLGLGKIGHNTAALLTERGFEVTGFTRSQEKASAVNEYGITVSGALNGNFKVKATTNIEEAVSGAKFLVVTTTSKGHKPMAKLLKGKLEKGQKVVVIEDLISTAGSVLDVVDALRDAGAEVLGIVSIFTYGMKKGLERLSEANVKNVSLTDFDTIARIAAEENYIKSDDIKKLIAFRDNPSDEGWIHGGEK